MRKNCLDIIFSLKKMSSCIVCKQDFNRGDNLQRHMEIKHSADEKMDQSSSPTTMTFKRTFSTIVSGPSASGKSVWTRNLLISTLIQPSPERIIWCFGQ